MISEWVESPNLNDIVIANPGEPIVNITPFTARQKVSGYVGCHVSHLMGGDEPALVFSKQRLVWRVPILLTTPARGALGIVGSLDVDARTGQLLVTPNFAEQISKNAHALTIRH